MIIALPIVLKALIVVAAFGSGMVSHYLLKLPKNNPVEEVAKEVIKEETGLDVDFESLDDKQDPEKK